MKRILHTIAVLLLLYSHSASAQVIRKNWREMTTAEKVVYTNAINALYNKNGVNVIETYVSTHNSSTYVRHNVIDFLPWHRMFLYYFELELKASGVTGASNIAIPYWGWETPGDWTSSSPLFSSGSNNLGLFGYPIPAGTFTRSFGAPVTQPTSTELDDLSTSYLLFGTNYASEQNTRFWPRLEAEYHNTYHWFVGGSMNNVTISPRDPIFYQHHSYVDKIWQDWHNKNGSSSVSNQSVLLNTVPGKPQITRGETLDSRSLKVWYAYNGEVKLNSYTVSGTENYRYTGDFTVANGASSIFMVPNGTTCNILSGNSVILKPGFTASAGSIFSARIDPVSQPGSVFNSARSAGEGTEEPVEYVPEEFVEELFTVAPNPSTGGIFEVSLLTHNDVSYQYYVRDMRGNKIAESSSFQDDKFFKVDLSDRPAGLYLMFIRLHSGKTYLKKIISR